jgi:poly(hydroxyalkanoate) depolymerase family esterase
MDDDFATALRRSLEETRAGNPLAATRLIQEALGTRSAAGRSEASPGPSPAGGTIRRHRRLSDVLEGLARRPPGLEMPPGKVVPPVEVPDGAVFRRRRHEGPHGARDYRLYLPSSLSDGVEGLILMLHGCTQSPEDFAVGTGMNAVAERNRMIVIYPEQARTHNPSLCWNWFRPGDQGPSAGEAALLASLTASVAEEHRPPTGRVFVAGLSAGGAMAAILANRRPDVFRAAGVHSGLRTRDRRRMSCRPSPPCAVTRRPVPKRFGRRRSSSTDRPTPRSRRSMPGALRGGSRDAPAIG